MHFRQLVLAGEFIHSWIINHNQRTVFEYAKLHTEIQSCPINTRSVLFSIIRVSYAAGFWLTLNFTLFCMYLWHSLEHYSVLRHDAPLPWNTCYLHG